MITDTATADIRLEQIHRTTLRVYRVIVGYIAYHGYPPTVRDIKSSAKLSNVSVVAYHMHQLQERGLISWEPGKARTIKVL